MILPVLSQRTYPGVRDLDDCWVIATIWAARCADPLIPAPSITEFRAAAGDPDDGISDGGSNDEVLLGARTLWPLVVITDTRTLPGIPAVLARIKAGAFASLAVWSAQLPTRLQFGFVGAHQIGAAWDGRQYVCMNPLDVDGAAPKPISAAELAKAIDGYSKFKVYGALFEGTSVKITRTDRIERWKAVNGNGVLRRNPIRSEAPFVRLPDGTVLTSQAEAATSDGNRWRLVEYDGPAWMLRTNTDWQPLVAGGDPALDKLWADIRAGKALDCSAQVAAAVKPLNDKIAAAKAALG